MNQLARRYRGFATLVVLAMVWLAPGIAHAVAPATDKLQVLVNDTATQLQLAYRQHPGERARRQEQLAAAVAAWRAAPRSEANNEKLAIWLRAAIVSSMPGSKEPLPAAPSFAVIVKVELQPEVHELPVEPQAIERKPQAVEQAIEKQTPAEAVAKPADDPFRDDPVSDDEQK